MNGWDRQSNCCNTEVNPCFKNVVNTARSVSPLEIVVVTGAYADAVKQSVQQPDIHWVHNPHWSTGMGGSIAMGSSAINANSSGLMILLCDQWRINTEDLDALASTWKSQPDRIVVSEAGGKLMPPAIFPSSCFSRLHKLRGDEGARSLFKTLADQITPVPLANAALDLDTPDQLEQMIGKRSN